MSGCDIERFDQRRNGQVLNLTTPIRIVTADAIRSCERVARFLYTATGMVFVAEGANGEEALENSRQAWAVLVLMVFFSSTSPVRLQRIDGTQLRCASALSGLQSSPMLQRLTSGVATSVPCALRRTSPNAKIEEHGNLEALTNEIIKREVLEGERL